MGVPKFFRYISERYPNLSELVGTKELPQFDNMYLDMNGIIHTCSHPDDSNVHFRITEEQIFRDIFHYIDTLFRLIQPQKLFFMAVDGVAPRAKMNQQRGRRFRSAREANELIEKAKRKGETLPTESRFDSNCITPGTSFMARLQEALKHFVKTKMSTDPGWRHCRFILSGHETPGEGEHKIMEYIRYLKSKPDFDPNTRHCLYGLDADLIMLGLCTHERQFSLLREEVKFGKKAKRASSVDEMRFYLLHLGLLRDYLELEFCSIRDDIPFGFDIERVIDDWVLMCYMVGNDFIPHLPNLHISSNALPILYRTYMSVLPQIDGYINEYGKLNLGRLEVFMAKLGEVDRELFQEHYADLKLFDTNRKNQETFGDDLNVDTKADLDELVKKTMLEFGMTSDETDSSDYEDDDSEILPDAEESLDGDNEDRKKIEMNEEEMHDLELSDEELFEKEFQQFKKNYYINKLNYGDVNEDVLADQTKCYITALQWTLSYYYRGVCSWGWYYPHHYAPFISDIKNFKDLKIELDLGKPFLPFEQLLAVLPADSKEHLPKAYHNLMTNPSSKLIEYYPRDFETDLNGKKQEWEAVVLIPFIDENKLIDAMNDCNDDLTEYERNRNIHGPMLQYDYTSKDQGPLADSPFGQAGIAHTFCKETQVSREAIQVAEDKMVLGPSMNAESIDVYFPGFPTMRHLKHSAALRAERVKVFEQASRNESMIIRIDEKMAELSLEELAEHFIGKEIYVGWPHLREAKVIAVSDAKTKITDKNFKSQNDEQEFRLNVKQILDHHLIRMGIDLGDITQLIHVVTLVNREYLHTNDGKLTLSKNWSSSSLVVAPKTIVKNLKVYQKDLQRFRSIESVFIQNSNVFMMNGSYYGSQGIVVDPKLAHGRLKVSLYVRPQPDFSEARRLQYDEGDSYVNSYNAAASIAVDTRLFNRITGTFLIVTGEKRFPLSDSVPKTNIGLQLKSPKHNEQVSGYTRYKNRQWLYSTAAVNVVDRYRSRFPTLFRLIQRNLTSNEPIFESELNVGRKPDETSILTEIVNWLKDQPNNKQPRRSCGTESLEQSAIKAIVDAVNETKKLAVRSIRLQVKPHLLYMPNLNDITVSPDATADYKIFDRVVIARDGYSVPLGWRGTIIAIHPLIDENPVRQENIKSIEYFYEVLFDDTFDGGQSIDSLAENRVFKVRESVLINISFGLGRPKNEKQTQEPTLGSPMHRNDWQHRNGYQQQPQQQSYQPKQVANRNHENKNWPSLNGKSRNDSSFSDQKPTPNVLQRQNQSSNVPNNRKNISSTLQQVNAAPNASKKVINLNEIPLPKQFAEMKLEPSIRKQENETQSNISLSLAAATLPATSSIDTSDVLRKILGISLNAPPTTTETSQPIDLNALFANAQRAPPTVAPQPSFDLKVEANMLPKPPSNWTKPTNRASQQQPLQSIQPPLLPQPPQQPPLPPKQQQYQNHQQLQQQQFHQQQQEQFQRHMQQLQHKQTFPFLFNNNAQNVHPIQLHRAQMPMPIPMQAILQHQEIPSMMQPHPPANYHPHHHQQQPHLHHQTNHRQMTQPEMVLPQPFRQTNVRMPVSPIAANFNRPLNQKLPEAPKGPHALSNNGKHMPGHGAFIPLQAARKNAKINKIEKKSDEKVAPEKNATNEPTRATNSKKTSEKCVEEAKTTQDYALKTENVVNSQKKPIQKPQAPKKQPAKRLACKFDVPPA